ASRGPWLVSLGRLSVLAVADRGEDAVGLDAPVAAGRRAIAEQALVGQVRDPGLAARRAFGRPGVEAHLAHRLRHLAHLLGAATAVLDDAAEEVGALLLPVDPREGLRQRGEHGVFHAVGA